MGGSPTRRTKQRTAQHVIGDRAEEILRSLLPAQWVLRSYRPDYGLDFALEVFDRIPPQLNQPSRGKPAQSYETLGEHLFIQLKGHTRLVAKSLQVFPRHNVEKSRLKLDRDDKPLHLEVIPQV